MERTTPGINDDPVAASYQFPKTQYPANKMEEIPSTSSVLPMNLPPSSERKSVVFRPCRVCGDVAKSYHFGGLCCDSCKTFFLESVDRNNYFQFRCFLHGQCIVTVESRANCQYCRMKRCFEIGMQKSWVVTEEERKMLMKARAEKKVSKKFASPTATVEEFVDSNIDYEPQIERMTDFLAPLEIKEIESIVTKYIHAYQHVPCRTELRSSNDNRTGSQVLEMFGTLIRRFAFYARLMPDFASLPFQDQGNLLRGGALEMSVLRGALVYDPFNNRWPNTNMSMYNESAVIKLENIFQMISNRTFRMLIEFIQCIQQMGVDEPIIMLVILIVLFTPEREGLTRVKCIEKYQAYYTSLLERYMNWRFGPARSKFMFSKLLTKLSDLRELSDTHSMKHNVQLSGREEMSSPIQQQARQTSNAYPSCNAISSQPGNSSSPVAGASAAIYPTTSRDVQNVVAPTDSQKTFTITQDDVSIRASSYIPQQTNPQVYHQQAYHRQHPYASYPTTEMSFHREPSAITSTSYYPPTYGVSGYSYNSSNISMDANQGNVSVTGVSGPNAPQPQNGKVTMHFMQAMQQSISQVASAPYFGFEQARPDYQFDLEGDDMLAKTQTRTWIPSSSPLSTGSDSVQSSDAHQRLPDVESATPSLAFTSRTMEELYEELEKYSA